MSCRPDCQGQALPKDLPPKSTAHQYSSLWDWDGTLGRIHHALYVRTREQAGHEASPSAAINAVCSATHPFQRLHPSGSMTMITLLKQRCHEMR